MDLVILFKVLLKRKWLLLFLPMIAAFIALFLTRGAKEEFKSSTQIATGFTITDQVSITEGKFNLYEIDLKFSNLIETFNSPLVIGILGYELLLKDLQSETPHKKVTKEDYKNNPFLSDLDFQEVESILEMKIDSLTLLDTNIPTEKRIFKLLQLFKYHPFALKESLSIRRVNRTDYISITAVTENPNLSAYIVNKLYEIYQRYYESEESLRTVESVQKWKILLDQKRVDLNEKNETLRRFKASNNLLNVEVETTSKIEQIANLESDIEAENRKQRRLILEIQDTESKLNAINSGDNVPLYVSNTEILNLRNKINVLNLRYESSGRSDESIYDSLQILRNKLQNLAALSGQSSDQEKKESLENILNDLKIQLSLSEQNVESITNNIHQLRRSMGGYAGHEARVATLEKEVDLASQEYLWAQEKYNQAVDIASASSSTIRQVVKGLPATKPEPSKRLITTALAGAVTFILCFVFVVIIEYMDTSIKSPANFSIEVGLNLLGSVNKMPKLIAKKKKEAFKYFDLNTTEKVKRESVGITKLKNVIKDMIIKILPFTNKFIVKTERKYELFNDQIRKIRFELSDHKKKIILFTSTKTGEGKTELIISLAEALSISNKKVLIVDTNFNHNSITQYYEADPVLGSNLKSGTDLSKLISSTSNEFIYVLGCESGNFSPFEILPKQDFFSQINSLLDQFDYIFLEGPAINHFSDSKELSGLANGIISVFNAKSVIMQSDKESMQFLRNLNGKFVGSILNQVEITNLNQ